MTRPAPAKLRTREVRAHRQSPGDLTARLAGAEGAQDAHQVDPAVEDLRMLAPRVPDGAADRLGADDDELQDNRVSLIRSITREVRSPGAAGARIERVIGRQDPNLLRVGPDSGLLLTVAEFPARGVGGFPYA